MASFPTIQNGWCASVGAKKIPSHRFSRILLLNLKFAILLILGLSA
jgi:hypothetical protein